MAANLDKPHLWKADVAASVDFYNAWFLRFAPETFRGQRAAQAGWTERLFAATDHLRAITAEALLKTPGLLAALRMATAPPLARDRLMGLTYVRASTVDRLEASPSDRPGRAASEDVREEAGRIVEVLRHLLDRDLFPWLAHADTPGAEEVARAALVVADRLCGAAANPIVRNAQEKRQLEALREWLERRGYGFVPSSQVKAPEELAPGTFTFRLNVPVRQGSRSVGMPIDAVVQPHRAAPGTLPLLLEAKSAGDFTNTNKRRKEEAQKMAQLRSTYGADVRFVLLLCGYFGADYLGYEASEGIDWVWEHRLDDLNAFGLDDEGGGGYPSPPAPPPVHDPAGHYGEAEQRRLAFQRLMDTSKPRDERNRLGQFATPTELARAMARQALALGLPASVRFLDPAIGSGAFFSAWQAAAGEEVPLAAAQGFEIDPAYAEGLRDLWGHTRLEVQTVDFTALAPPAESDRATLVLANPPYSRHHHLDPAEKARLARAVQRLLGVTPSGLSGLHAYFLYLAHGWMAKGALAGWLIPSEFMSVGYGREMRRYLSEYVTLLHVHRFDTADVQFADALVSSAVVWFRNAPPPLGHRVRFTEGGPLDAPRSERWIFLDTLRSSPKWPPADAPLTATGDGAAATPCLGDLFVVRRGLATGGNDFFLMTEAEAQAWKIPPAFLRPVLPSPRYLTENVVERLSDGTPALERRRWLLDCSLPEQTVREMHPGLWRYLERGVTLGVADRYLCASRSPWYAQEKREPAPFLCSYMGRGEAQPFRFFWNRSDAVATNVFLNLYPRPHLAARLRDEAVQRAVWNALQDLTAAALIQSGRTYGGGLHKLEPKELASAPLAGLEDLVWSEPTLFG